jgi:hypothetical protein
MSDLSTAFSALGPSEKAMFLARVAHMATVAARVSYINDAQHPERAYDHPDGVILRDANNFVHRVTGYIMHALDGSEGEGQDAYVITTIQEYFQARGMDKRLYEWLGISD